MFSKLAFKGHRSIFDQPDREILSTSLEILKKYWGHEQFRPLQKEIIDALLNQDDVLALLPTGGGKSICYQIPALQRPGICLVISPLIALMHDQVEQLNQRGIKARFVSSTQSPLEIDRILDNACYDKELKFLYVSPERIQSRIFKERVKKMPLNLIAVDEAHCISEWGHDFRPDYSKIKSLREWIPTVPVLAVTATATEEVVLDIQEQLELKSSKLFRGSFKRDNIAIRILKTENKLNRLEEFVKSSQESGIIYCATRKNVKMLSNFLKSRDYSVEFYHGGLRASEREIRQRLWLSGERKIMIATNAFGMGIDKANVRFVLHYDLPDNPEAFYQEIGRAGRDGLQSVAKGFYLEKDIADLELRHALKFPEISEIQSIYKALGNYFQLAIGSGKDEMFSINLAEFCSRYELGILKVYNVFKLLEIGGFIRFSERSSSRSRIRMLVDAKQLYDYQLKDKELNNVIQFILRTHIGVFDDYVWFNEYQVCKNLKIDRKKLDKQIHFLVQHKLIDYSGNSGDPQIIYLIERLDEVNISIPASVLVNRKKAARLKLDAMKSLMESTECLSAALMEYFGEKDHGTCGQCSVCIGDEEINGKVRETIRNEIIDLLNRERESSTLAIISNLREFNKDQVTDTLRWMQDHKLIDVEKDGSRVFLTEVV